jgi:hypothetical protein
MGRGEEYQPNADEQPWSKNSRETALTYEHPNEALDKCIVARTHAAHAEGPPDPFQNPSAILPNATGQKDNGAGDGHESLHYNRLLQISQVPLSRC